MDIQEIEKAATRYFNINVDSPFSPKIEFIYVKVKPYEIGWSYKMDADNNLKRIKTMISGKGFVFNTSVADSLVYFGDTYMWVDNHYLEINDKKEFEYKEWREVL